MSRLGYELSPFIQFEPAVAGIAIALGRSNGKEAVTLDGDIQRIARTFKWTLAKITQRGDITDVGHFRADRFMPTAASHEMFDKHHFLALEACGVHIGEVVGDDVQLTA